LVKTTNLFLLFFSSSTIKPRLGLCCLYGTRITVDDIVVMHLRMGQSLAEIAGKYDLSLAAVHAAMAFYYDHKAEIDERITQDEAYAEAFERNNPSLLKEKLRTLRSE
jgi:uncharacterized protein (DUF433 family)